MGRRNKSYSKDLHQQAYERLNSMQAFGESRRAAKSEGADRDKIFSFNTYKSYWKHTKYFIKYIKEHHPECTTLKKARKYVSEWLQDGVDRGLSAWTIGVQRSAIGMLYGIAPDDEDFFKAPKKQRENIKRSRGVRVRDNDGYLPFEVRGPIRGGEIDVDGSVSSQFITGLLLALPLSQHDTTLHVRSAVSTPYLDMTVDTAARFGVEICHNDYKEFYIEGGQRYRPAFFSIEGDWSAAAMLLVAGAVAGEVTVKNVSMLSKQADTAICTALVRAGAAVINDEDSVTASHRPLRAFEFDATHCPDLFPALAALAAAAQGESVIRGTSRLEHKECNRADAIREEYAKAGIEVDTSQEDVMRIRGGRIRQARVQSHGDHRMAMSMAVAGLLCDGEMTIEGAECVAKSYPGFFEDLEKIRI